MLIRHVVCTLHMFEEEADKLYRIITRKLTKYQQSTVKEQGILQLWGGEASITYGHHANLNMHKKGCFLLMCDVHVYIIKGVKIVKNWEVGRDIIFTFQILPLCKR